MRHRPQTAFTATHHALLFAWISREVVRRIGTKDGEAMMRAAVRRYGEERGRRMALRALADGQALDMASYLAYGEWEVDAGQMMRQAIQRAPDTQTRVYRCPWHTAWSESNLLEYGRLYCLDIDEALVRGFNPVLRLEVNRTQTNEGEYCEFIYRDVGNGMPKRGAVMPWEYHAGHLYKTVGDVLLEQLGSFGQEALSAALAEFSERYGQEAASLVVSYRDTDFSCVPR